MTAETPHWLGRRDESSSALASTFIMKPKKSYLVEPDKINLKINDHS